MPRTTPTQSDKSFDARTRGIVIADLEQFTAGKADGEEVTVLASLLKNALKLITGADLRRR